MPSTYSDTSSRRMRSRKFLPVTIKSGVAHQKLSIALGRTFDGWLALDVFRRMPGGFVRVVTARDMNNSERRIYRTK
jgi:uncharacterized DUF497 family protein